MLRNLFGLKGRSKEDWTDRAKAHRRDLRDQQEMRQEATEGAGEAKAQRRAALRSQSGSAGRKGFGKRGDTE